TRLAARGAGRIDASDPGATRPVVAPAMARRSVSRRLRPGRGRTLGARGEASSLMARPPSGHHPTRRGGRFNRPPPGSHRLQVAGLAWTIGPVEGNSHEPCMAVSMAGRRARAKSVSRVLSCPVNGAVSWELFGTVSGPTTGTGGTKRIYIT